MAASIVRQTSILLLLGVAFIVSSPATQSAVVHSSQDERPNILLIVGEDHGCELSCYGDPVISTPNIDRLAEQGILFENGYVTQSVCSPSRSTLFTGLYPHQNGQLGLATHQFRWFKKWPTTYSLLKQAGYRTGLIGKTHVNPAEAVEDFVDFRYQPSSNFSKKKVAQYAIEAGKFFQSSEQPFFMTVNYPDAHWPLQDKVGGLPRNQVDPEKLQVMPYVGGETPRLKKIVQSYYNCMLRLDECVGQLLHELDEAGKADDTLVVFIGDHGAQMARGKVTVYEGGIRVPYIARWPRKIKPGQRSQSLVSTVDLLPTFMDVAKAKLPEGLPGKSLSSVFQHPTTTEFREYLFCERNCDAAHITFPQRTVRDSRFKLIHSPIRDREDPAARYYRIHGASHWSGCLTDAELAGMSQRTKDGYARWLNPPEFQLYDLHADPHEWNDLATNPEHSKEKARLLTELKKWQVATNDPLRHAEKRQLLMAETDALNAAKQRSPKTGWKYLKYLQPPESQKSGTQKNGAHSDVLWQTSFENGDAEKFDQRHEGLVKLTSSGTCSITTRFAKTGERCLRMLGDQGNSLTFELPESLRTVRGISFFAERWTKRDPFEFSIDVQQDGKWNELAQLDEVVAVGARFLSHVQLSIPVAEAGDLTAIRVRVKAAGKAGLLLDDVTLHESPPERPTEFSIPAVPTEPLTLLSYQPLFVSGTQDTHTFRIPAICTATNGDLIAACDARRKTSADLLYQRTIDIVLRRSEDNGDTWSLMETMDPFDDAGCSDPSLLVDEVTGDVFCFYNYMAADKANKEFRFILQKSSDHGKSWQKPIDFTDQVAGPELKGAFKFITSGRGIQARDGQLLHNFVNVGKGATLFGSRDHGRTWKTVGTVSPADESKVVELGDNSLMVNSRKAPGNRFVHRSVDGGSTWKTTEFGLPDPKCNASILQYTTRADGYTKDRLLFCNAASNRGRKNLAVRISYDHGLTWSDGKVIDKGPSAYSEMTVMKDGTIGVLYEPGYSKIRFVRFSLNALTSGMDDLQVIPTRQGL